MLTWNRGYPNWGGSGGGMGGRGVMGRKVEFALYKMLFITLCKWHFLKRNKAYTRLNDFVIPITCLKFNQVPPKSKISPITPNGKGCQRVASNRKSYQKVANSLWLRLPTIFVSVVQYTWFSLFLCFYVPNTHSPHNQELSNFALKTKLSFAVRCGHFRRKRFQPFVVVVVSKLRFGEPGSRTVHAQQSLCTCLWMVQNIFTQWSYLSATQPFLVKGCDGLVLYLLSWISLQTFLWALGIQD